MAVGTAGLTVGLPDGTDEPCAEGRNDGTLEGDDVAPAVGLNDG